MALHRCVVADFLTETTLTEIDLSVDTCQRRIVIPGAFRATYPLPNRTEADRARHIVAGRTNIHMYRDSDLWGSYLIRYAQPAMDENGKLTLQIAGSSLEIYPYLRKIRADLTYAGQDQITIARALLSDMATRTEGDMGLDLMSGTSGVLRDRTYLASESATYGQRLEELANVANGFEHMIRVGVDSSTGARTKTWIWGYPTLGNPGITRVIDQPGQIKAWAYAADATQAATAWQARGATIQDDLGTASQPLMSTVYEDAALLAAGWPLLDQTADYLSVREVATLNAYAQQLRDTRSGAVGIPRVLVHFDDAFSIDPNFLGDTAAFTLVNDWFPLDTGGVPTFAKNWRIVGMDLHTPTGEDQEERAELIFEEAA